MIPEKTPENLLIDQLSRKLNFAEMEKLLLSVTSNLASDSQYTVDDALPELIRIIRLLDYEQEGIMEEIIRLEGMIFEHSE